MLLIFFLLFFVDAHIRMDLSAQSHPDERIRERDNVKGKLSNRDITFTAPLSIGSEEDKVRIMVNTGSNLFWVPTRNCDYYSNNRRDTIPEIGQCDSAGIYLPSASTLFHNTSEEFVWHYGKNANTTQKGFGGYFGTDKVQYGDYAGNMTFGIGNEVNHIGELGLGFRDPGMTYSNSTLNQLSFLQQLVKKGDIQRNAYSFQLGINNASEGTLQLGAVDHSKYEGKLQKVKMVDLYSDSSDSISILLDGISGTDFSMELNMAVAIRIEEATSILPDRFFDKLIAHLNAIKTPDDVTVVPCSMLNSTDSLSFYFSGIEIQVPLRDLIFQESTFGCCLTIDDYDGPYHLGQDILKSAYVVVDLDNKEVALAQATNSSSEDIEDIVSEIPSASEAPLYSYTEVAEKYYYSDGWVSSSYDVSSRPSYSTNTGSRSVDLGSTTYMPFYTKATTIYDYFASQRNSGHFTRCSPFSFLLFSILLAL